LASRPNLPPVVVNRHTPLPAPTRPRLGDGDITAVDLIANADARERIRHDIEVSSRKSRIVSQGVATVCCESHRPVRLAEAVGRNGG
jgi:hypothetical protein